MPDLEQLCNKVNALASETGTYIQQNQLLDNKQIETKGPNNFVTEIDKESERRLVKGLSKIFPEAGFITEEDITADEKKAYNWIIDPLDGTTNFIHGLPPYSISIALSHGDEIVLGVVYEISSGTLWYARKDGMAYMNDKQIGVSGTPEFNSALVTTGFAYKEKDFFPGMFATIDWVINNTHGIRRFGSAAVDLCYLAMGRIDIFYESGLHVWDVSAASLIVKQAGGQVTDFYGGDKYFYGKQLVATNGRLHESFMKVLQNFMVQS